MGTHPYFLNSQDNQYIRLSKNLKLKKYRDKNNLFIVEGHKNCTDILNTTAKIKYIFITNGFSGDKEQILGNVKDKQVKTFYVSEQQFESISNEETPQGILFIVEKPKYELKNYITNKKGLLLIVDRVQDPGNLGTILRTSAAFDLSCVILTRGTVDLYNPKVVRSSCGFLFNIPIVEDVDIMESIKLLSNSGFSIIASDSNEGKDIDGISNIGLPCVIIVGNEGSGVDREILKESGCIVKIPISKKVDSLNVGVATGILIYEIKNRINNLCQK